ncbi:hypothetical protein BKA70DRAFT_1568290 [Coprinopsis sp. MPI-PUGE-AT-0042]|nr:hypothetical protein BKA70DRAFT_1568290 [Coprinopsis sp. MPI-PUGE-AT-0042]
MPLPISSRALLLLTFTAKVRAETNAPQEARARRHKSRIISAVVGVVLFLVVPFLCFVGWRRFKRNRIIREQKNAREAAYSAAPPSYNVAVGHPRSTNAARAGSPDPVSRTETQRSSMGLAVPMAYPPPAYVGPGVAAVEDNLEEQRSVDAQRIGELEQRIRVSDVQQTLESVRASDGRPSGTST